MGGGGQLGFWVVRAARFEEEEDGSGGGGGIQEEGEGTWAAAKSQGGKGWGRLGLGEG
jgi:hypothetical protein